MDHNNGLITKTGHVEERGEGLGICTELAVHPFSPFGTMHAVYALKTGGPVKHGREFLFPCKR